MVPKTALTDRIGCLKGDTLAGLVVPTPTYVRFATHYRFRPDSCQGADPEPKGLAENLVGYAKADVMIPQELSVADLAGANEKGLLWCDEVNAVVHSEICAVTAERLVKELEAMGTLPGLRATIGKRVVRKVDRASCVRFGSARYSVPTVHVGHQVELVAQDGKALIVFLGEIIATHDRVAPGETSVLDEHSGGPRPMPTRAVRPRTSSEKAFCALGPPAESFIKGAAARGITSLKGDLDELARLEAAHGKEILPAALERGTSFGRFRPTTCARSLRPAPGSLVRPLRVRPSSSSCRSCRRVHSATTRLASAHEHRPSRPLEPRVGASQRERAKENLCLVGPAGTGKSHLLVALGHAAIASGFRVHYLQRGRAGRDPLSGPGRQLGRQRPRGDPQGRPDPDRRDRLRADGSHRSPALLPPGRRRLRTWLPRHRLALAPSTTGGDSCPTISTAVSLLDRLLHHNVLVVTEGESSA